MDLYVASGSVEWPAGDPMLRDRLYLNDGAGRFARATDDALPEAAGATGAVSGADFDGDGDGDLDLFVAGRVISGRYPIAPPSHLLHNDGGRFVDITDDAATGLRRAGLVTGAVWSDADGDGRADLLLTLEWGPVRYFHNGGGRLEDRTAAAGLADRTGWWNGIAAADLDVDGDMDYVVTNFGLNSKCHASPKRPALLHYGDFENRGKKFLVEAEYESDAVVPIRGRSCSSRAMPFIAEKFQTFHAFGLASLSDVYTAESLGKDRQFRATCLASGVLFNERDESGAVRFRFRPLPNLAQSSAAFGVVATDLDADGQQDIYIAHNFFGPQLETGHIDGGVSLMLRGMGGGKMVPVWPACSGLVVPGDARAGPCAT